jgi:hypothetical protein
MKYNNRRVREANKATSIQMDSDNFNEITKDNFWQVIHDNQKGKYYQTRLTLLDEYFLINETIQL